VFVTGAIAVEKLKLAIEIDGRRHHDNRLAFENDRAWHNELVAAGCTVLQFTWRQVTERPDQFVAMVRTTISRLSR